MADDIIDQLAWFVTNEVRMPAGLTVTVIDEIERLRSTRSTARLMADVIVLLRDQLPVGSDGRRWAEDALKAYQDGFGGN